MIFAIEMQRVTASKVQKSWMESTSRGFENLAFGRKPEAARCWFEAGCEFSGDVSFDPLRAASRANAGSAHLLLGNGREAAQCFDDAERSWENVIAGIATLNVPMTGASSSFHFRLASKIPDVLIAARRSRYRRLVEAAFAITQFNRALIDGGNLSPPVIAKRAAALKPMLSEVLGSTSAEVRLLASCSEPFVGCDVAAIYADKFSDITSRQQTFAAALSEDCANLESAVGLTALLALPIFISTGRLSERGTNSNTDRPHQLEHE